jgi:predicted ATPase
MKHRRAKLRVGVIDGPGRREAAGRPSLGSGRCYGRCGACFALVYGWFTEGFDTLDLKEAKALLDELAS